GSFAQPAHGEGQPTHRAHFNRHLVVRATDTTALDLDHRARVLQRLAENLEGLLARLAANELERAIEHALGNGLLAVEHHDVDELRDFDAAVQGIGQDFAFGYFATTWHWNHLSDSARRQRTPRAPPT